MQLEKWCEDGSKLVASAVEVDISSSINDLAHFMNTHDALNLDEIWTSEATYVHVLTLSLQVLRPQQQLLCLLKIISGQSNFDKKAAGLPHMNGSVVFTR